MSFQLPNGSTFEVASAYDAAVTITAISNANPAVVTAAAHGLSNGDVVLITSGWSKLNGRIARVANSLTGTFALEGIDTTDTSKYPAGSGVGSVKPVSTWVQVPQITEVATSGGEQQFATFGFLEEDDDRQIPTTKSPSSMTLTVADDPTKAFVAVVEKADEGRSIEASRLHLVNGSSILYSTYLSITQTPTLSRNNIMTRAITLSLAGRTTRYSA
ncbi:phage tail protein [Azotobacter beijerinckii]|uniref:Phage tail tube protein, TTP n=1 Tax=Azotobacter beijerinckii TaxID=170623 RepID=A0A1I0Z389_9GAMM|nr:phage tail protein [Azotobacter beijerinckii]SFB19070.1 Phage tail tube protein, TTP [Azotobacter beijerinckii]